MAEQPAGRKVSKEELAYLEQLYQNQYVMVGNAINSALGELQELNSAQKALEEMDRLAGRESFSGIGADFYLKAQIKADSRVVVGVGGGFLVEKDAAAARQTVKKRLDAKNAMLDKLVKSRKELEAAMVDIQSGMVPGPNSV
jgi:prefoldin alpha subunit